MTAVSSEDPVERFRALLGDQLGLAFEDMRGGQLSEVLNTRVSAHGGQVGAYLRRLEEGSWLEELSHIARVVTVGETYFFRHGPQFEALRAILADFDGSQPPRLLSAGCASGEEAYSLAVVLRELWPDRDPSVVAVDLNPAALAAAARGRYAAWSLRETPPAMQAKWFRSDGRDYIIDEGIRRSVRFVSGNLAADEAELLAPQSFDVIFARNVLMYFTPDNYRASVARLARALTPEGYLFLGSAETLRGVSHDFHLCHTHGAFYYRLKSEQERRQQAPSFERLEPRARQPVADARDTGAWVAEIGRAAARILALSNERAELPVTSQSRPIVAPVGTNLRAALDLLHKEQFAEALEHVRALPAVDARDPETMLLEAVLLASAGKFSEAQMVCQRLLERDELSAGAHYVLALCSAGCDQLERAAHHDRVAVYLDPAFAMPKLHLGLLLRRSGNASAARAELAQARSLLEREDAARVLLFGGGFNRSALLALCDAELALTAGNA